LERTEIIEISSLGWRPRAHPIYHARPLHTFRDAYSVVKEPGLRHTCTPSLPTRSKLDRALQITDKNKKGGGHFWWPPPS